MTKDELASLYVRYLTDGDESFLQAIADDAYDNVSGQRGRAIWTTVRSWIDTSFAEPSVETHWVAQEKDRITIWLTVHATHVGSTFPWLKGRAATGRRVAWRQVHMFRMYDDTVAEHWAVRDDLRVLEAIDATP